METPTSINVRSPLSIRRCVELVENGKARNFSEAADTLILIGAAHEDNREPVTATARDDGKDTPQVQPANS